MSAVCLGRKAEQIIILSCDVAGQEQAGLALACAWLPVIPCAWLACRDELSRGDREGLAAAAALEAQLVDMVKVGSCVQGWQVLTPSWFAPGKPVASAACCQALGPSMG